MSDFIISQIVNEIVTTAIKLATAKVEVKLSNIPDAGNGVFAKTVFLPGDEVTRYGGDFMNSPTDAPLDRLSYCLSSGIGVLVGGADFTDPEECGSIINEAFKPQFPNNNDFNAWYDCLSNYYSIALQIENCRLSDTIIATKRIEVGQELLIAYGFRYWVSQAVRLHTVSISTELFDTILAIADKMENELKKMGSNYRAISKYIKAQTKKRKNKTKKAKRKGNNRRNRRKKNNST